MARIRKIHIKVNDQYMCSFDKDVPIHTHLVSKEGACKHCLKKLPIRCKVCGKKVRGPNHHLGAHHNGKQPHKSGRAY